MRRSGPLVESGDQPGGCHTLAYDHVGFAVGDDGPRKGSSPSVQLHGYRDAIAWLAPDPAPDPAGGATVAAVTPRYADLRVIPTRAAGG